MPNGFSMMTRRKAAVFFLREAGGAELLDDRAEQLAGDGKIKDCIAAGLMLRRRLFEGLVEPRIGVGLGQVAGEMGDAARDEIPGLRVERLGCGPGSGIRDKAPDPLGQIIAIGFDRLWRAVDGDDREFVGQQLGLGQIVDGRHQEPLRQITAGAKNHQGAWRRLVAPASASTERLVLSSTGTSMVQSSAWLLLQGLLDRAARACPDRHRDHR